MQPLGTINVHLRQAYSWCGRKVGWIVGKVKNKTTVFPDDHVVERMILSSSVLALETNFRGSSSCSIWLLQMVNMKLDNTP